MIFLGVLGLEVEEEVLGGVEGVKEGVIIFGVIDLVVIIVGVVIIFCFLVVFCFDRVVFNCLMFLCMDNIL